MNTLLNTLSTKKIGILGFGLAGKSVLRFLYRQGIKPHIFDTRTLQFNETAEINQLGATLSPCTILSNFVKEVELIIPSPGVDLRSCRIDSEQLLSELDLFYAYAKKPITAITGTIGKTTITHFLSQLFPKERQIITGGNIGIGMLDLLEQDATEYLLEISSFQLEACHSFAPDLAVWTSFFPNHLDRHGTVELYFQAKLKCLQFQTNAQKALLPLSLRHLIKPLQEQGILKGHVSYFADIPYESISVENDTLFYLSGTQLIKKNNGIEYCIGYLPKNLTTYELNWLVIGAALHLKGLFLPSDMTEAIQPPPHRGQKIATWRGINFYNDSKATIMQSTLAAVQKLGSTSTILLLGGISKGVDRKPFLPLLKPFVKYIICFGKEADELYSAVQETGINTATFPTLEEAFAHSISYASHGDQIVLSPGGASYDLYTDYQKRGEHFIDLVKALAQ